MVSSSRTRVGDIRKTPRIREFGRNKTKKETALFKKSNEEELKESEDLLHPARGKGCD